MCCGVPCRAVPCCAVLCCAVLCCAVLCCAVLCCAVLCCAVQVKVAEHVLTRHKVAIKILNRRKIQAMDMEEKGVIIEHEFHRLSKPGMSAPKGAGHACRGQSMEVDVRGRAWCVGRSSVLVGVCGWMGGVAD
jgi:hypothetical protein